MKREAMKNQSDTPQLASGKVGISGRIYALDTKEIPSDRNLERVAIRYNRWLDALPTAISTVVGCEAMKRGDLFKITSLEQIDGNAIEFILLDVLVKKFIIDDDGNCDYEHDEEFASDLRMRKRSVCDAQVALLNLLDYRRYCDKYHAGEFYKAFYKPGTTSVDEMGKRAVSVALARVI